MGRMGWRRVTILFLLAADRAHALCLRGTCKDGLGVATVPGNGGKYSGEWKNGAPSGLGVSLSKENRLYEGQFKAGVPDGHGVEKSPSGLVYRGEYRDAYSHGVGSASRPSSSTKTYFGEFKKGKRSGCGRLSSPGVIYGESNTDKLWKDDMAASPVPDKFPCDAVFDRVTKSVAKANEMAKDARAKAAEADDAPFEARVEL